MKKTFGWYCLAVATSAAWAAFPANFLGASSMCPCPVGGSACREKSGASPFNFADLGRSRGSYWLESLLQRFFRHAWYLTCPFSARLHRAFRALRLRLRLRLLFLLVLLLLLLFASLFFGSLSLLSPAWSRKAWPSFGKKGQPRP